ncbi:MAG: HEPN domain-containing protein [Gammaproteobacteria bacterium]|nr:HEPN domain-containing protein [Gammaproteobacteria bacterium]
MTADTDFQVSVQAADSLLSMYAELRRARGLGARGRLDAQNEDLLWLPRSAVVAAISALDSYIHAVLNEKIPHALQANPVPEPLCKTMADLIPIKNANTFSLALPVIAGGNVIPYLSNKYKEETLSFLSYQSPDKIIAGYALIGYEDIFTRVSAIWPGPNSTSNDIKRQLANYVKRRNQIAHEGDRDQHGQARHMQPRYARDCKEFVANLVSRLNRVVYGI